MRNDALRTPWTASWIWRAGDRWTVDCHLLARHEFDLPAGVEHASLRIGAFTDYKLLVNGTYIGRGPCQSDPYRYHSFDTIEVAAALRPGRNTIAIVCHNYGIGLHWHLRGPGGLIAQLDVETADGAITVATGSDWRICRATSFAQNSPRMFWASGFMETFLGGESDDRWLLPHFDDGDWEQPEVEALDLATPRGTLIARDIPLLQEFASYPVAVERGEFLLRGVHAVSFDGLIARGDVGLVYARTAVFSPDQLRGTLHLECDDACKLFVNGELVVEQGYDETFARTRIWRALDDYEQLHDGMGPAGFVKPVTLHAGWNSVLVVVDCGPRHWGFTLAFRDPEGAARDLRCKLDGRGGDGWRISGPFASSGLADSLDTVSGLPADMPEASPVLCDPFDYRKVTDYATLMRYEQRRPIVVQHDMNGPLMVRQGEYCVFDLGMVRAGYPSLSLDTHGRTIVDVGYSQILNPDHRIAYSGNGQVKYVDRVVLPGGRRTWQPLQRRTCRYVHISCREGSVTVSASFAALTYPVGDAGVFECSDPQLNRIWEISRYTTHLLMQNGYQDCLRREESTLNHSSFNFTSRAAALCFGDQALARHALRTAIRTQNESGWFQGQGISSPNNDEPTEMLWWVIFLRDYWLYTGDFDFLREVYPAMEDTLRYMAKAVNRHGLLDGRNWPLFRPGQGVYLDDSQLAGPYLGAFAGELAGDNILYYGALRAAADLAHGLNDEARAGLYERKARRVRSGLNERLWDSAAGRFADWRKGEELAAAGHPVFTIAAHYFQVPEGDHIERAFHHLCHDLGLPSEDRPDYPLTTFGFYFYFLEVLYQHDRDDLAYELLRRYYGRWLEAGGTTFGEHFRLSDLAGKARLDSEYEVHAYGTSAHLHFYTHILGVRPESAGFGRAVIAPHPGDLKWAHGAMWTPHGIISIAWELRDDQFRIDVGAPEGVDWTVIPPAGFSGAQVIVNGCAGARGDGTLTEVR